MIKKIKQLLTPIPTATYVTFPNGLREALISLANGTQAFIYLTISKFCITLGFLLHELTTCEVDDSHSIACVLLMYEGFCLIHYSHYKKEIVNIEKLTQIYQLIDHSMIEQPLRVSQSQIVIALKKILLAQTPELHRESKYLMLFAQIIIIRFFVILIDHPFNYNIFHYFSGVCDENLLNVVFVMVFVIFLEFIVIYIVIAALIFAFPALGCLCLYRKLQKAYQIYKVKRHFQSFPTHKYTGIEDNWITDEKSCCICMQEYQNNENLLKLPCTGKHIFHEICIRNWLEVSLFIFSRYRLIAPFVGRIYNDLNLQHKLMNTEEIPESKKAFLRAFLKVWKMKKDQEQQKTENEPVEEQQLTQSASKSQVFSREEYAKDQFWEDRYKEHKGTFDWYVEWPELKFYLEESEMKIKKTDSILMVGCGNSKLSEQMYKDGYLNIVSIDISQTIVDRMQQLADQQQLNLKYLVMDATAMQFKDLEFDVAIDKGTLDALSCGEDIKNLALLKEMSRVARQNIIISHSSHTKRHVILIDIQNIISQAYDTRKILETKIKLSGQSELINIIRTKLKDKPLSHILKDKVALVQCIQEYKTTQKLLKDQPKEEILEYTISNNIVQQIDELNEQDNEQDNEQEQNEIEQQINETVQNEKEVVYDPRRQSHCFIYKIL